MTKYITISFVILLLVLTPLAGCRDKKQTDSPQVDKRKLREKTRRGVLKLIREGKLVQARDRLQKHLKKHPEDHAGYNALAHVHELLKQTGQARVAYTTAHRLAPRTAGYAIRLIRVCHRLRDMRCALSTIDRLLPNDHLSAIKSVWMVTSPPLKFLKPAGTSTIEELNRKAIQAMRNLRYRRAGRLLKQARAINHRDMATQINFSVYYLKHGNWRKGLRYANGAIDNILTGRVTNATTSQRESLRLVRAVLYHRGGRFDKAIPAYRQALKLNPKNTSALLGLGALHFLKGDRKLGLSVLERLKPLSPVMAARLKLVADWKVPGGLDKHKH